MSLRSIGTQLLQTAPTNLLSGASTASLSLWVRVNSANNVANGGGVEIFGDAGGKFSATLSGTGTLKLRWSSTHGGSAGGSSCSLTLTPGTSYHLAAVWQDGAQGYYLNGASVLADAQPGSIGVLGDASSHPFRLGSDSSGTDVSLGDPTLWVGYALSAQDVLNLRNRTVAPSAVAPSSIALEWSLAGGDGVAAKVGDAGLADASPSGLNLSTIVGSSPAYQAAALTYFAPPAIGRAMVAPSGEAIALIFEDGSGRYTSVSSLQSGNDVQTLSFPAPPITGAFTLTFNGQKTAPIPVTTILPQIYGQYVIPVTAGRAYQLSVTYVGNAGCATAVLGEVYDSDGRTRLGSSTYNAKVGPSSFTRGLYSDAPCGGGNVYDTDPVPWQAIATVTPTGSTITVRLSATTDAAFIIDGLLVKDLTSGTYTAYDDGDPSVFSASAVAPAINSNFHGYFRGTYHMFYAGSGLGSTYRVDPAAVLSALQALPSILPGGVRVAASDANNDTPIYVEFIGPMGGTPQPAITSSEVNMAVVNSVGSAVPTISINGGTAIPLKTWAWAGSLPWALCPLHQAAPATQTLATRQGNFYANGQWYGSAADPTSLGGYPYASNSPGDVAYFPFQALPPGTFQAAITWTAAASLSTTSQFLVQDGSGKTLATRVVDQTAAPGDYAALGHNWKVLGSFTTNALNSGLTVALSTAGSTKNVAIDAVQLIRTSADSSLSIAATDSVTMSVPSGWVTTAAGPIAGVAGMAVSNLIGGSMLPAFQGVPKTMAVGYNTDPDVYYNESIMFSNMAGRMSMPLGIAQDANGYPTLLPRSDIQALVSEPGPISGGNGKSVLNAPNGRYTLLWDGASDLHLGVYDNGAISEVVSQQVLTRASGNRRVYDIAANSIEYSPRIFLNISGTGPDPSDPSGQHYLANVTNIRIYPPDPADPTGATAWVNPPKFHPTFLYKLQGAACIRFMDPMRTNFNPYRDFADIKTATGLTRGDYTRLAQIPIASCQAYTGPALDTPSTLMIKVTTLVPHTLFDGCFITILGAGTATLSDGTSFAIDLYKGIGYGLVSVIDATTFAWHATATSKPNVSMTNTATGGYLQAQIGTPYALQDVVDLCNAVGADCWFNVPTTISDDCVNSVADFFAAHLAPGKKVHLEYGNECWNFSFYTYVWTKILSFQLAGTLGGDYIPAYVHNAKHVHDLFGARFAAAGRPNDMINTFCTQGSSPDRTNSICQYATLYGARIDELGCAPYFNSIFVYGDQVPIYDFMTSDQCLDALELNTLYNGYQYVGQHRSILDGNGFTRTNLVCYEGGPESLLPVGVSSNFLPRLHAVHRHPRMYGIMLYYLQRLQNEGCKLFNDFYVCSSTGKFAWSAYEWYGSAKGTGNATTDAINASNPEAMNQVASEVGGAISRWCSLFGLPVVAPRKVNRNGKASPVGSRRGRYQSAS